MKTCPSCGEKIPLKKFFLLTNNSTLKCSNCNSDLVPDKKTLSIIGGISGFSSALTVGLASVVYYLLDRQYLLEIIIVVFFSVLSIFFASSMIMRNILNLTKKKLL